MVLFTNYTAELPKFEWKQDAPPAEETSAQDGKSPETAI